MEYQKCKMGHDAHMYHLTLSARADKSPMNKDSGSWTVDAGMIKALKDCYGGDKLSTMKIGVSCYSGFRSRTFQQGLEAAGFKCGNMYNIGPGAQGLFAYDNSTFVKGPTSKGSWSCPTKPSAGSSTGNTAAGNATSTNSTATAGSPATATAGLSPEASTSSAGLT